MRMKFIQQYDEKDCGPTCLSMVARYYGKKVSISKLRELAGTDKIGTNLFGLVKAGEAIGLNLTGVKADSLSELKVEHLPVIANIITKEGYDHYVIIEKFNDKQLYIIDPAKGKYKMDKNEFSKNYWTNILILIEKANDFTFEDDYPKIKNIFIDIFKANHKLIWIVFTFSIIINLIGVSGAFYFKALTDFIIPSNILSNLHYLSLGLLLLYIINALISYIRYQLILKLSLKIDIKLMKDYFLHVLHLPMNFFDTRKNGEILSRFMDISKIREALSSVTVTLLVDTLMIFVGGILLYLTSPKLLLFTLIFIPLFIIFGFILKKPFEKYNRETMEVDAALSSYLIDVFSGSSTIKSYSAENEMIEKGHYKFDDLLKKIFKLGRVSNVQLTLNNFLKTVLTLMVLWLGSKLVIEGNITLGDLLAFNALIIFYLDPIERLINTQPIIQSSIVAARRIVEITDLDTEKNLTEEQTNHNFTLEKNIKLSDVTFQYGYRNTTLKHINMDIPSGTKISIVGESGSGKSTIGKLLSHYYNANEGDLYFDDISIQQIKLDSLRSNIGYVSQDIFLFNDTIRNNLKLGINKAVSDRELLTACNMAYAHEFIEKLPNGLDTMIERNGNNLSGGQAQRLALARVFLKNPKVYVFDEATSSLDNQTEKLVMKNINKLVEQGKTIIIISHELTNIIDSDIIYLLSNGEIIEQGTHNNLLDKKGEYYKLWKIKN